MNEMISKIRSLRWHHILLMLLITSMVVGTESCKSSGKLSRKERKAQIEAAKKQLTEIIDGTSTKTLEQQDKIVNDIIRKNLKDPTLDSMIAEAQQVLKKAFAEREKARQQQIDEARADLLDMLLNKDGRPVEELERELARIKAMNLNDPEINELIAKVEQKIASMKNAANVPLRQQLEDSFQGIADAGRSGNAAQAASLSKSVLNLFSGDDAPVLIIISREGSMVDYDKPTTIRRYLDFLRDQKVSRNAVDSYQLDANGKIKELDLIKK
jgi:hypothetical protein